MWEIATEFVDFSNKIWESFLELRTVNKVIVGGVIGCLAAREILKIAIWRLTIPTLADDPKKPKYDPNKIYLHIFPRQFVKNIPNVSPFVLRLETWLRLQNIKYEVIETIHFSRSTQQIPYIFHKGREIADSLMIMEYLEKEFEMDSKEGLTPEQQSVCRALVSMMDERTAWCYTLHRMYYAFATFKTMFQLKPSFLKPIFSKNVFNITKIRGIGRKTANEVYTIGKEDIKAISLLLGNKPYLMGDKMTKVDCTIFGHIGQIMFIELDSPFKEYITTECSNIARYVNRMKEQCWPDWNTFSV